MILSFLSAENRSRSHNFAGEWWGVRNFIFFSAQLSHVDVVSLFDLKRKTTGFLYGNEERRERVVWTLSHVIFPKWNVCHWRKTRSYSKIH